MWIEKILDKNTIILFLLIALYIPIVYGLYIIPLMVVIFIESFGYTNDLISAIFTDNIIVTLTILYCIGGMKLIGQDVLKKFEIPFNFYKFLLYSLLFGLLISLGTRWITINTYEFFPTPEEARFPITNMKFPDNVLFYTLSMVPMAAAEELLFRGLIFSGFRAKYNFYVTTIITTLLFLSVHPYPEFFLSYITGEIAICLIYEKWKSLPIVMVIHIIFNGCAMFGLWGYLIFQNS